MARSLNRKCLECSKLPFEEARGLHGPQGDGCWDDSRCHKRRSHYRNRGDRNATRSLKRQQKQQVTQPQVAQLSIPIPDITSAVLIVYSDRPDDFKEGVPIHAIGAELWTGDRRIAAIEPIHCFGMRGDRVTALLPQILEEFSSYVGHGKCFTSFAVVAHRHARDCPLMPCPFHP
jgi:hypothetical protein